MVPFIPRQSLKLRITNPIFNQVLGGRVSKLHILDRLPGISEQFLEQIDVLPRVVIVFFQLVAGIPVQLLTTSRRDYFTSDVGGGGWAEAPLAGRVDIMVTDHLLQEELPLGRRELRLMGRQQGGSSAALE